MKDKIYVTIGGSLVKFALCVAVCTLLIRFSQVSEELEKTKEAIKSMETVNERLREELQDKSVNEEASIKDLYFMPISINETPNTATF